MRLVESGRARITALLVAFTLLFGVVAVRLVHLQVLSGDELARDALEQRLVDRTIPAARGTIFDRNGRDLALDVPREFVFVDPSMVRDEYRSEYARRLAPVLGIDAIDLYEDLGAATTPAGKPLRFRYLSRTPLTDRQVRQLDVLGLPGVATVTEPDRDYPGDDLAAPILGAVQREQYGLKGLAGLEKVYDDELTGTPGRVVYERDREGREIPHTRRERTPAVRGNDLILTIDSSLQNQVEQTLVDQVAAQQARRGIAIVIDVHTGDVLAMATAHGADADGPARPADAEDRNRAVTDVFEPGSTNKIITVASAMDAACVAPESVFDVPGRMANGDAFVSDDHVHGLERWNTRTIISESSNVGTAMIAKQCFDASGMDAALRNFGYGSTSGVGLPDEEDGILKPPDEYYSTGLATASFGYGMAATPMQVLDVYTTIANGGRSVQPRIVRATVDDERGRRELEIAPGRQVVTEPTATAMADMLIGVVATGTAPCASVRGYEVAGKTGTARKVGADGRYLEGVNVASFVGFAPARAPRLAAIVVLDEPAGRYGGTTAAPVFAEIMQFALRQERVVPTAASTAPAQWDAAAAIARERGNDCSVPHGDEIDQILADRAERARAAELAAAAAADPELDPADGDPSNAADTVAGTDPPDE